MKRWIAFLIGMALCFTLAGCQSSGDSTAQTTDGANGGAEASGPLLYRVTDDEGNVAWLFGSIHIGREDFYPLPDAVIDAFEGSDALAVEADIITFEEDLSAQMQAMQLFLYTDGSTIQDHVSEELYEAAVTILTENGVYLSMLDYYTASFWSSLIDSCLYELLELDIEGGIDRYLMELAAQSGKDILEVESVMFQYRMLAGFSAELQESLLEGSVAQYQNPEESRKELNQLMDLWVGGDEAAFAEYLTAPVEYADAKEAALYEEYNDAMIVERNEAMAEYVIDALASGKEVFVCVGAAHVVGEGAMAELLAEAGYTVECYTEEPSAD